MNRKILGLIVLTVILLIAFGCSRQSGPASSSKIPGNAVALVNGEAIPQNLLTERVDEAKAFLQAQGVELDSDAHQEILRQVEDQALEQLVQEQLILQEAKKQGIEVTEKEVEDQLAVMRNQLGKELFDEMLASQNISEERLKEDLQYRLLEDKLYRKVTADVRVSDEEVRIFYEENKDNLTQIQVSHILIQVADDASGDQVEQAREKTINIINMLDKGADFAALAQENSDDPGSKDTGGLIDLYFTREDSPLVPEFTEAAFKVAKGQYTSEPVRSSFGWHIIKVNDRRSEFTDLKEQISARLTVDGKNQAFSDFFNQLEEQAIIDRSLSGREKED